MLPEYDPEPRTSTGGAYRAARNTAVAVAASPRKAVVCPRNTGDLHITTKTGTSLKTAALQGAGIGGVLGTAVPGVGNAIGTVVGGIIGGISSIFRRGDHKGAHDIIEDVYYKALLQAFPGKVTRVADDYGGPVTISASVDPGTLQSVMQQIKDATLSQLPPGDDLQRLSTAFNSLYISDDGKAGLDYAVLYYSEPIPVAETINSGTVAGGSGRGEQGAGLSLFGLALAGIVAFFR